MLRKHLPRGGCKKQCNRRCWDQGRSLETVDRFLPETAAIGDPPPHPEPVEGDTRATREDHRRRRAEREVKRLPYELEAQAERDRVRASKVQEQAMAEKRAFEAAGGTGTSAQSSQKLRTADGARNSRTKCAATTKPPKCRGPFNRLKSSNPDVGRVKLYCQAT